MQPERRVDHDHPAHALRMMRGDEDRKISAERVTAEHHAVEAEPVEQREHVSRMVLHAVARIRLCAPAPPAQVWRDDAERGAQAGPDEAAELVRVRGEAVQENERRIAARSEEHTSELQSQSNL